MKSQSLNRIAELRLKRSWSQSKLAESVKAHKITISKLERGNMRLTQDWMLRLAKALNVLPSELLSDSSLVKTVCIDGFINDKFEVQFEQYDGMESAIGPHIYKLDYGVGSNNSFLIFEVNTSIFYPIIHTGDLVRFSTIDDWMRGPIDDDVLGRLAVVETEESEGRLIGFLERSTEVGAFDLRHPLGGFHRGVRPTRVFVLTLVMGLPNLQVEVDDTAM